MRKPCRTAEQQMLGTVMENTTPLPKVDDIRDRKVSGDESDDLAWYCSQASGHA
jgi:hypothetical protein